MKLGELVKGLEMFGMSADADMEISGVSYDSRRTKKGDLFVAMSGYKTDGYGFIGKAAEAGAACVVCERPPEIEIPYVRVANARRALALIGANWFGHPAEKMKMVGVTGTNGKTTTTYLLKNILEAAAGAKVGLIGTNQNMIGAEIVETERTTPESFELQKLFSDMLAAGCTHVVMEVSSHALYLDRVYGIPFDVGIFTNLTQDHLDFHGTMEKYCDAKALLFRMCRIGVYNADDKWSGRLMRDATCEKFSYAENAPADLRAENVVLGESHVGFDAVTEDRRVRVEVGIPGGFMVYNSLDVLGAAMALGVPLEKSAEALGRSARVKGRVEVVPTGTDYTMLIDYAHTPDAIDNVLTSVRGFARGRVVALFGCGGDRDRTKRPKMGALAAQLADFVIVTSDNPRTEQPADIINEILAGMKDTKTPYVVIENRVEAIHYAMDNAKKGDVIVLCGKGHETYQIIGTVKHHLDEREIIAEHLKK
jgi:UDP-N-acetylmuramoyl-L-alanyl-D-glutamate--2,6-diaminopimelate ligase